jgi:hypothetical protein
MIDRLRDLTRTLLDPARPTYSLRGEVMDLKSIFEQSGTFQRSESDISSGQTETDSGVAISPTMAAMCLDDFARTVEFIRGLNNAIVDQRSKHAKKTIRILYAGCGPWATLAVPLMSLFTPSEVLFILLDIHDGSIRSVKEILGAFDLEDRVEEYVLADATRYRIDPAAQPDIIVIEMLRAALDGEPQVSVAMHLGAQAADAVMIPEKITIDLALVDSAKEFSFIEDTPARHRIVIGNVYTLDRTPSAPVVLTIPDFDGTRHRPMLLTTVRVYGEHILSDYDSGITCPKELRIDGGITPGDEIEFEYELGREPRLKGKLRNR